jgi:hypothetical protein
MEEIRKRFRLEWVSKINGRKVISLFKEIIE